MSNSIVESATAMWNKGVFTLKKHSPEIALVAGIGSVVAGAVVACKATITAVDILDDHKKVVDAIHECHDREDISEEEYPEEQYKKELAAAYIQTGWKLTKTYAPAFVLGGLGIMSIVSSHGIMRNRNVSLAAAYATLDQGFKKYRSRVVDRFGEQVDHELKYDIQSQKVTETVVDEETGKEKKAKKTLQKPGEDSANMYSRMFDAGNRGWTSDPLMNLTFLKGAENYFNQKLERTGYVWLNEVYDYLGYKQDKASRFVGWIYDVDNPIGDNHIDFGFHNNDLFMNGYEASVRLDFNVDGNIMDRFEMADTTLSVC